MSQDGNPNDLTGDLGVHNNMGQNIYVSIKTASVPFEGAANPLDSIYNRYKNIQAGTITRYFNSTTRFQFVIDFIKAIGSGTAQQYILSLAQCNGSEYSQPVDGSWGFAKYQFTIKQNQYSEEYYTFYLNSLDSKYGQNVNGVTYGRDIHIEYRNDFPEHRKVFFYAYHSGGVGYYGIDTIASYDTIAGGLPSKEFKVWEIAGHSSVPLEKNFYARTTPFPISPVALDSHKVNSLILGTKVLLDTVFYNFGSTDKWGYNTVIDAQHYNDYYIAPPIINRNVNNHPGETFTTPAWPYRDEYGFPNICFTFKIQSGDSLILKRNKYFWVTGYNYGQSGGGDTVILSPNSYLNREQNAEINLCYNGVVIDSGSNYTWNNNSAYKVFKNSSLNFCGQNHVVNNRGKIVLDTLGNLVLGNNTTLTFDGSGTYLQANVLSKIKLGANAKIEFKNGASLIANESLISSTDGQNPGVGFILEDAGTQTSITNCTFTNLKNSIKIVNNSASTSGIFRNITNNTFNANNFCNFIVELRNAYNVTIQGNQLNMPVNYGMGLLLRYPINLSGNEEIQTSYNINIIHNTINNGAVSAMILSQTSSLVPINFVNNTIQGSAMSYNFIGRQITGTINNNTFSSNGSQCRNFELTQSGTNVLRNIFSSPSYNIALYQSNPNLAPLPENPSTDGGLIWLGGNNKVTSSNNGNIFINEGYARLDWGQNCFVKSANTKYVWGGVNTQTSPYYNMRNNDFNGTNTPSVDLFGMYDFNNQNIVIIPYLNGSDFACETSTDLGTIWQIINWSNGIKDTIYKTPNNTNTQLSPDDYLYTQSYQEFAAGNYFAAITYLKTLINTYPHSTFVCKSAIDLYTYYQMLDTSGNQGIRNTLFNDLKNYLDNKILSGLCGDDFNNTAYNISLMCMVNMTDYNDALSGYELIALYHPEAYIRLMASWDYDEILSLLNGSGGISSKDENMTENEYLEYLKTKVNSSINEDPVKQKIYRSYVNTKNEKDSKLEKDIFSRITDVKTAKSEISRVKSEENKIERKSISVLRYSKSLKKEEKEKNILDDFLYSKIGIQGDNNINNAAPKQYDLSQNYPNPFNPSTTIKYSLPKDGKVTLKIYDITGKEIKTLVNDIKLAGNYTIDFNGSNLASGVYFYRIQTGDFVQTKRMVLVK